MSLPLVVKYSYEKVNVQCHLRPSTRMRRLTYSVTCTDPCHLHRSQPLPQTPGRDGSAVARPVTMQSLLERLIAGTQLARRTDYPFGLHFHSSPNQY